MRAVRTAKVKCVDKVEGLDGDMGDVGVAEIILF
jgi:hypothetical protein